MDRRPLAASLLLCAAIREPLDSVGRYPAMKNFSEKPAGPKGALYRAVNERVAEAAQCKTFDSLVDLLGPPDKIESGDNTYTPSKFLADLGSIFRFGDERAEIVVTYVDPYRPRYRHKFGIVGGRVDSSWREVVDESRQDHI